MSFWKSAAGVQTEIKSSIETGGGNMPPIPSGTKVKAFITQAEWKASSERDLADGKGQEFISIRWDVCEGEYKKRVVFQKIFAEHTDHEKQGKALEMLMVLDFNTGGELSKETEKPDDMSLSRNLCNKPMVIQVQVWEFEKDDGEKMSGNWVNGVYSASEVKASAPAPKDKAPSSADFDDDIPF